MAKERRRLGIPPDRKFATNIELGGQMIERVSSEGIPFEVVCCDMLPVSTYRLSGEIATALIPQIWPINCLILAGITLEI